MNKRGFFQIVLLIIFLIAIAIAIIAPVAFVFSLFSWFSSTPMLILISFFILASIFLYLDHVFRIWEMKGNNKNQFLKFQLKHRNPLRQDSL
mgnify:CR=1 FL=1